MRAIAFILFGLSLSACEAPSIAEKFAETPVSTQVCSFYVRSATDTAQAHCSANGANAEMVGRLGTCDFNSGPGRQYSFMTAKYPDLYNFRCVR